jgi:putative spermidine/putrescine transport system permease protein
MPLPPYTSLIERWAYIAARVFTGAVLIYLIAPILVIVPLSFTSGSMLMYPLPGTSLRYYIEFFTDPVWTRAVGNSFLIATVVTVNASVLGTIAALGLNRSKSRLKPLILAFLVAPLALPVVIMAVAVFYYFAWLNLLGTYLGMILAHSVLAIPFVVITVTATLQGFDINMSRAGASLGASPIYVFRKVTLPLILPGVISGSLFAFVISFDEIVIALFIASPVQRTLPRQIFSGVSESVNPTITVAAVVLFLVSISMMTTVELLRRRGERLRAVPRSNGAR